MLDERTPTVGAGPPEVPTIPTPDFDELLKQLRERVNLTQERAAALVGVSRPTFAQWEGGRHLPTEDRVRKLDDLLAAHGALVEAFERIRSTARLRPVEASEQAASTTTRPLLQVFRDIRRAAMDQLVCDDDDGRPLGWRHNLVPSSSPPAVLSTGYVLKALTVLGGLEPRTTALVGRIFDLAIRDDGRIIGWRASTAREPRIETTATCRRVAAHRGGPRRQRGHHGAA